MIAHVEQSRICKACGFWFVPLSPTRQNCYSLTCIKARNNSSVRKAQARLRARIKRRR